MKKINVHDEEIEVIISKQKIGAFYKVMCGETGEFTVEVLDPKKSQVRVKSLGGGVWNKFTVKQAKLIKLTHLEKLPAPPNVTFLPIIDSFTQIV